MYDEATVGILGPALVPPSQREHQRVEQEKRKDNPNDWRLEHLPFEERLNGVWGPQLSKKVAAGD